MPESVKSVLVIGAGVGGIKASLDLAEAGFKVYLTDRAPGIGGTLLQLESWFPDTGCELCKLLPVFSRDECSQFCLRREFLHPNIELISNAELISLTGTPGNFQAGVKIKARGVISERCTACGLCAGVCPVEVGDEFDRSMQKRKAIYVRNPQAIPNVYTIDYEKCTRCGKCVEICPTKAVVLDMPDENRELNVGAVIVATGLNEFDASQMGQYGYGRYANVLTNIELERMLADAGPTGGQLRRSSDGKTPEKIAILQCVGSRDTERGYCSEVCCMYALKEAMLMREKYPDSEVTIYYMDLRAFGKDYYRYHLQAKEMGVGFERSRVSRIRENPRTKNLYLLASSENGDSINAEYDMVVLSTAQCPSPGIAELSKVLDIKTNEWGFVSTPDFAPARTSRDGIFVGGFAAGPVDISETVIQSGAAACEAATLLGGQARQAVGEAKPMKPEEPRIAVFICRCGQEISSVVDIPEIEKYVRNLTGVVHVEDMPFPCLPETLEQVKKSVTASQANRVIMAACTPYHYHRLFSDELAKVGIGASAWQLVNFREQLAWVHKDSPAVANGKARHMLSMAAARLAEQEPLRTPKAKIVGSCLVVGGGVSGLVSALSLSRQGLDVTLVEKTKELGGSSRNLHYDFTATPQAYLKDTIEKVMSDPRIKVVLNTEPTKIIGHAGHFRTSLKSTDGTTSEIEHGAVIVATGARDYKPTEYLYSQDKRVITQSELQKRLSEGKLGKPETIVMIQCVGSRNEAHPYCNRSCCSAAITNALKIKEQSPETQVFILNRDIMSYGFRELYYKQAREAGVLFHRFEQGNEPKVSVGSISLAVELSDPVLPGKLEIEAEFVVLSTGVVAGDNNPALAKMLDVELTPDGFFKEIDTKFRPVDALKDGIFITGSASAPRNFAEKIIEAQSAAQRAATILTRPQLESGGIISEVDSRRCSCCGLCVEACPFDARSLDADEKTAVVEEVLCQGCGICASVCPNSAAKLRTLKDKQVFSMIDAAT